jgi:hypothetical protein
MQDIFKMIHAYIYGLKRNGAIVDQTSIDERSPKLAGEIMEKKSGDQVVLLRRAWD